MGKNCQKMTPQRINLFDSRWIRKTVIKKHNFLFPRQCQSSRPNQIYISVKIVNEFYVDSLNTKSKDKMLHTPESSVALFYICMQVTSL